MRDRRRTTSNRGHLRNGGLRRKQRLPFSPRLRRRGTITRTTGRQSHD
jgi:hypothetical protein